MTIQSLVTDYGAYAGTFIAAVISGFVPLIAIDAVLVAIAIKMPEANLPIVVLLGALGTLLGKLPVYYAVRALPAERAKKWLAKWKKSPVVLLILSSFLGLPPFSIVGSLAGACGIKSKPFIAIVLLGRIARFAIVVTLAVVASS